MTPASHATGTPLPLVGAPMAGGPTTPQLAAAVSDAGGLGSLAAGYLTVDALREAVARTRALTTAPFAVNMFVPRADRADAAGIAAYAATLQAEADRLGVALGEPRWDDDAYAAKLDLLAELAPHTVSFTFGPPSVADVERLHAAGVRVSVTVTGADEAGDAAGRGADVLVVQGTEAGGHQGGFADAANDRPLLEALTQVRAATRLPLVAAGAIMTAADARAARAAGADGVQVGTALLCAPEAGTAAGYRAALLGGRYDDTVLTRAFTGRWARGLANRFAVEHSAAAPGGYPQVHHLTRPLRRAAADAGDADVPNLWAGTGWRAVSARPAAEVVHRIGDGWG